MHGLSWLRLGYRYQDVQDSVGTQDLIIHSTTFSHLRSMIIAPHGFCLSSLGQRRTFACDDDLKYPVFANDDAALHHSCKAAAL